MFSYDPCEICGLVGTDKNSKPAQQNIIVATPSEVMQSWHHLVIRRMKFQVRYIGTDINQFKTVGVFAYKIRFSDFWILEFVLKQTVCLTGRMQYSLNMKGCYFCCHIAKQAMYVLIYVQFERQ